MIRKIQISRLLEQGLSNRNKSSRFCVTIHTVKNPRRASTPVARGHGT